jgi:serine/threonine protein kinase
MTLCINPRCDKPQNADNVQFCQNCQSPLLLKQRYRATKVLGSGGFGKTYEASDLGTPNKVIKVLINNSPKAVELFQREAEVLGQLNNPGIPRVEPNSYTVFHPADGQDPVHCLVMEKVEGMNLRDYLKQLRHPIDSETAERWLKELVLILQAVHERGILHRDIKPQNIIFKPDGKLALIDFGAVRKGTGTEIATAAGGGTEVASHMASGTTVSSVGYTAPEQMNGEALRQSDFYSLGKSFIFLLTGKEPSEISYDAHEDVLQWRRYAPDVESKLETLIDQMTSTLVRQRPQNAQDILRLLTVNTPLTKPVPPQPDAVSGPVSNFDSHNELNPPVSSTSARADKAENHQQKLQRYEQEFRRAIEANYPLLDHARKRLRDFQESLGLQEKDIKQIEGPILTQKEAELHRSLRTGGQHQTSEKRKMAPLNRESRDNNQKQKDMVSIVAALGGLFCLGLLTVALMQQQQNYLYPVGPGAVSAQAEPVVADSTATYQHFGQTWQCNCHGEFSGLCPKSAEHEVKTMWSPDQSLSKQFLSRGWFCESDS